MNPYPQSVNPAIRAQLDAQIAFFNELSGTMSRSLQQVFALNMQTGQALIEDASSTAQRMLSAERPTDALSAAASHPQPVTDKLRTYQEQLSQLAASIQADLARVTEQHVQQTSRTARAMSEDAARGTADGTEKSVRSQADTVPHSQDGFKQEAQPGASAGAGGHAGAQVGADSAAGKPAGQSSPANVPDNMKGAAAREGSKAHVTAR